MYKPLWALVSLMCLQHSLLETEGTSVNKCDIKQPTKGILNLKHQSNPAKLLNETAAYSLRRCSQICCNTVRCNAYIWRNSEQCFLFYCKIVKDCKVVPYQGTVTGFVSREAVPQGSGLCTLLVYLCNVVAFAVLHKNCFKIGLHQGTSTAADTI